MTAPKAIEILPFILGLVFAVIVIEFPRSLAFMPGVIGLTAVGYIYGKDKIKPALPKLSLIILIGIAALAALSSLWAIDSGYALERSSKLIPVFFAGLVCISAIRSIDGIKIRPIFMMLGTIIFSGSLLAIFDLNADFSAHKFFRALPPDSVVKPAAFNRGTVVLCFSWIAVFSYFIFIKKCIKSAALITVPLLALMAFTDSQSTQLALLVALIFLFAFPINCKISFHALGGVICALTLAAPFITPLFYAKADFINSLPFFGQGMGYAGPRLEIWDYVGRYVQQNPLFGYGLEATRNITDFDSAEKFIEGNTILHPHNFALQLWIEFGVIGALAGCALIITLLRQIMLLEHPAVKRAALASFMAVLSISATGYGVWQSWWIGTLLFTLAQIILLKRAAAEAQ